MESGMSIVEKVTERTGYAILHFHPGFRRSGIRIPQQFVEEVLNSEEFKNILCEFEFHDRIVNMPNVHWMESPNEQKVQRFLKFLSPITEKEEFGIFKPFQFKEGLFRVKNYGWTSAKRILKEYESFREMTIDKG